VQSALLDREAHSGRRMDTTDTGAVMENAASLYAFSWPFLWPTIILFHCYCEAIAPGALVAVTGNRAFDDDGPLRDRAEREEQATGHRNQGHHDSRRCA